MHQYLYDVIVAAIWIAIILFLVARWTTDAPDPSDPRLQPKCTGNVRNEHDL